jgi:hypothetical protein
VSDGTSKALFGKGIHHDSGGKAFTEESNLALPHGTGRINRIDVNQVGYRIAGIHPGADIRILLDQIARERRAQRGLIEIIGDLIVPGSSLTKLGLGLANLLLTWAGLGQQKGCHDPLLLSLGSKIICLEPLELREADKFIVIKALRPFEVLL